jgi:plasmid replication initiation protein
MNWLEERELETLVHKRDGKIALANEVIDRMRMGLTAQQQDILDCMLKEIQPDDAPEKRYSISIANYCQLNNITAKANSKNYQDIKRAIKDLNCKWIRREGEDEERLLVWFKNVVINHKKATIEYNIDDTMIPYLFGLPENGHYTQWRYRDAAAMRSKYAKHLYKILLRYYSVNIKNPLIPIEKLKALLDAEKYDRFPDFRRNVLDAAQNDINAYTFMKMEYEPVKEAGSRGYTHIAFRIEMKLTDAEWQERVNTTAELFGEKLE